MVDHLFIHCVDKKIDVLKIVSSMQEIVQVITSLFECVIKENDMISL